jgi:hypothetical protein
VRAARTPGLIFGCLVFALSAAAPAVTSTVLAGTQKEKLVRLAPGDSYLIRGDYHVPAKHELQILAGTLVQADKDAQLSIAGTLLVKGTRDRPVVFRARNSSSRSWWKGIKLTKAERADIDFASVQHAVIAFDVHGCTAHFSGCVITKNTTGMRIRLDDKGTIENCIISKNKDSGMVLAAVSVAITSCTISQNGGWGIDNGRSSAPQIRKSVISGNAGGGVYMQWTYDIGLQIHDSYIGKNKKYDVLNKHDDDFDFSRNWWGPDTTSKLISEGDTTNLPNIYDGNDEERCGKVRLHDFLRAMPKDCGAFASGLSPEADISKGSKVRLCRDSFLVLDSSHFNGFHEALAQKNSQGIDKYLKAGYVIKLAKDTSATALAAKGPAYGVRVLDGRHKDKQGWVLKKDVEAIN